VPGEHNENTKLLGFYANNDLVLKVDEACAGTPRSQFLREAVVEYMAKKGHPLPEHLKNAPSRAGKGGPKPLSYRKAAAKIRKKNKPPE
jgi:hypothetical protein